MPPLSRRIMNAYRRKRSSAISIRCSEPWFFFDHSYLRRRAGGRLASQANLLICVNGGSDGEFQHTFGGCVCRRRPLRNGRAGGTGRAAELHGHAYIGLRHRRHPAGHRPQKSAPLRSPFSTLGIVVAFAAVFSVAHKYSILELWAISLGVFAAVRYAAFYAFHKRTRHRGIFHSLLAGAFFMALTAVIFDHVFGEPSGLAWLTGLFLFIGFSSTSRSTKSTRWMSKAPGSRNPSERRSSLSIPIRCARRR